MGETIIAGVAMGVIGEAVTQFTKRWDFKPLNCGLCMTWWLSVGWTLGASLSGFYNPDESLIFIASAVFTRQLLFRLWPTMY